MSQGTSFVGGLDLVAQLNLVGPRDFLLQLEEELESYVRGSRKELIFPPLSRRYQELLISSLRRFNLNAEAVSGRGWSNSKHWKVKPAEDGPPRLPKVSLAEFLRLQRRSVAPPGAISQGLSAKANGQTFSEEEILQRLRLRLWAVLLCCAAAERAVQADTLMAPAVEPVEPDDGENKMAVEAKEEVKEELAPTATDEVRPLPVKVEQTSARDVDGNPASADQEVKLERTLSELDAEVPGASEDAAGVPSHGLEELVLKEQPKEEPREVPALKAEPVEDGGNGGTGPLPGHSPLDTGSVKAESLGSAAWVKVRQEPEDPPESETPGLVRCGSAATLKEEPEPPETEAKLEPQAEEPMASMSPEEQDLREALRAALERLKLAAERWTADEAKEEEEEDLLASTVHCFRRFSPGQAPRRLYLRDSLTAPWPTVKLLRDGDHVVWRPEWSLPHFQGPGSWEEGAAMGGIFSWALEPNSVSFGEGFEVNLRDEPGPSDSEKMEEEDVQEERLPNDFLLSFRRGYAAWHFTAGTRGRSGAQKMVPDTLFGPTAGQRQMFWAACLECHDGKHYVLVGTVPGMLSEHFFVAKVARSRPLTHVGFSYLPTPKAAVFGAGNAGLDPLWIESITIYPHGLSGELPFISHRFVQVVKEETVEEADTLAEIKLEADPEVNAEGEAAGCEAQSRPRLLLLSKKAPGGEAESRKSLEDWCQDARRELGLPPLEAAKRSPSSAKKRRRTTAPVSNAETTPSSWGGPSSVRDLGPYEDSLRHMGV